MSAGERRVLVSGGAGHDVTFPLYVEVDEIYNLACPASPVHYQHDPVQTVKTSVLGAIKIPVSGLAETIVAMTGSRSPIVRRPLPADDPVQRCPDIERAQILLNWTPTVSLPVGLERTIAYFDAMPSGDAAEEKRASPNTFAQRK